MGEEELAFAGVREQARLVQTGAVTPSELVELYLARIERLEPKLNAFRVVLADRARADAKRVEQRLAAGEGERLPLAGVPIAIKDCEDVEGVVTRHGSDAFDQPAAADSEHVRRLRAAGAIVLGKTNLPELAIYGFTEGEAFGVTRNPWNLEHTPGGSSGGSGAAVAAGMCAAASATDGAGSIRIPAACCALFGLKPQRDRIPVTGSDHWHHLSVVGALTRFVADTALWLDVATTPPGEVRDDEESFLAAALRLPGSLRIAYSTKPPWISGPPKTTPEVADATHRMAELLRSLGHRVERRDPDWGMIGSNVAPRYMNGIARDVAEAPHPERLEKRTLGFARIGRLMRPLVGRARRAEARDARRILRIFNDYDVLMTPTIGEPPIEIGRWRGRGALWTSIGQSRTYPYCVPWNHLGNPAASVPAGFTSDGLPLAVQLVGRRGDEATLLSLASQIEQAQPWSQLPPAH
jgi:amidase